MMRKNKIKNFSIRFRRWSRKQYAVFCSLGKQISIGCLRRSITDQALRKNALILKTATHATTKSFSLVDNDLKDSEEVDSKQTISDILFLKIVLSKLSSDTACPDNKNNTLNTNTIC